MGVCAEQSYLLSSECRDLRVYVGADICMLIDCQQWLLELCLCFGNAGTVHCNRYEKGYSSGVYRAVGKVIR